MKIYTKTGDAGTTGLYAGPRVPKDHPRIEAYGTVDELNAALGMARSAGQTAEIDGLLAEVQHQLFAVGAALATPDPAGSGVNWIGVHHVQQLEAAIDAFDSRLPPLACFILPAGSQATTSLHLARAVCRRAERRVVTLRLAADPGVSDEIIVYLNRLGDLLFVLSRAATAAEGGVDVAWEKPSE